MLRQVFRWRHPLQRPVGALIVVLIEPSLDDLPGLSDRAEPPAVQAAIAKDPVEALIMAALTGATGRDVMGLYALGRQPLPYRLGDEPRAVVALEIGRWAIVGEKLRQLPLHLGGRDRARHMDLEPDARVLIDHGQTAKTATVRGLVGYEVDAPDVVRVPGAAAPVLSAGGAAANAPALARRDTPRTEGASGSDGSRPAGSVRSADAAP